MAGISHALRLPFTDFRRLSIGALLLMIPGISVFTGLFTTGYLLHFLRAKNTQLPQWTDWTTLFLDGLRALILSLVWFLPAIVIGLIVFGDSLFTTGAIASSFGIIGSILVLIVFAITTYLVPSALILFARARTFSAGLAIRSVIHRSLTKQYLVQLLLALLVYAIINLVLGILAFALIFLGIAGTVVFVIITGYASFISAIIAFTLIGYVQTK